MSSEAPETDKQKTIAEAAFAVFATHGFRRTSMEKIAAQAGMSRPALYLHFQNKEDVFAFLTVSFFEKVASAIATILAHSGAPADVLKDLFEAFDPDGVMAILLDADHGHELMEFKTALTGPQIEAIETRILQALRDWLAREAAQGKIDCSAPDVTAQMILSAFYGLKSPPPDYATYKARAADLARVLGRGLLLAS